MVEQILRDIEKDGFSLLHGLVPSDELRSLNRFFDEKRSDFLEAKVGPRGNRQRLLEVRGDYTYWLDPLNPVGPLERLFTFLNEVRDKMNESFFLGLREYECHLAYYPAGTFYKKHLDRHEKNSRRRLTFVFYLNQEWREEWGGELVMYHQDGQPLRSILPTPGTCLFFLSDEFPHEVKAALRERRSFTGWMHTEIVN